MTEKLNRYILGAVEGFEMPYDALLECKRHGGFPDYMSADRVRKEIIAMYGLSLGSIEISIRR